MEEQFAAVGHELNCQLASQHADIVPEEEEDAEDRQIAAKIVAMSAEIVVISRAIVADEMEEEAAVAGEYAVLVLISIAGHFH